MVLVTVYVPSARSTGFWARLLPPRIRSGLSGRASRILRPRRKPSICEGVLVRSSPPGAAGSKQYYRFDRVLAIRAHSGINDWFGAASFEGFLTEGRRRRLGACQSAFRQKAPKLAASGQIGPVLPTIGALDLEMATSRSFDQSLDREQKGSTKPVVNSRTGSKRLPRLSDRSVRSGYEGPRSLRRRRFDSRIPRSRRETDASCLP